MPTVSFFKPDSKLNDLSSNDFLSEELFIITHLIAAVIEERIHPAPPNFSQYLNPFYSQQKPAISLKNYLQRFPLYDSRQLVTPTTFTVMCVYLERYANLYSAEQEPFYLNVLTLHRLCAAALLIAHKYLDDNYMNNARFAKFAGIPLKELNNLELELAQQLDFNFYVAPEIVDSHKAFLEQHKEFAALIKAHFSDEQIAKAETFFDLSNCKEVIKNDLTVIDDSASDELSENLYRLKC